MEVVKKIELILENCDVIDITNAVGAFSLDDISSSVYRIAQNCIGKSLLAKTVFIQIYKDGELEPTLFDDPDPIKRLSSMKDITGIDITYADSSEKYSVDYDEGEDERALSPENINESVYETENSLFILISANKTFEDYDLEKMDAFRVLAADVNARTGLKNAGWKELFHNESLYQIYMPSKRMIVSLDKSVVKICKVDDAFQSVEIDSDIFKELLSYLYDTCGIFDDFNPEDLLNLEDFVYLPLGHVAKTSQGSIQTHQFRMEGHDVKITFDTDQDQFGFYDGLVRIDHTYEFSIKDLLDMRWILLQLS